MKKKAIIIIGIILLLLLAVTVFVISGGSTGRALVSQNGSVLLIKGNEPIVMSDHTLFGGLNKLKTGDKIFVLHDGVNESYPGQTAAYFCVRLGRGDISDISESVVSELAEMGWLSRERSGGDEPHGEDSVCAIPAEEYAATAHYEYGYANMSLSFPEGWEYEIVEYDEADENANFGIRFWPEDDPDGTFFLCYWPQGFGVCGTGLTEEVVRLSDALYAYVGTYDNSDDWSFVSFRGAPGSYVVLNEGSERSDEVLYSFLCTAVLGEGVLTEEEALSLAPEMSDKKYTGHRTSFDFRSGEWTIKLYNSHTSSYETIKLDYEGNIKK